ncbi:MAG: diacylglycerol kinase family lipid kinase [Actinobacteria bacterium]|nr:diacylglycerol kinase family lipid kinase [Actinomycetota bacterium]
MGPSATAGPLERAELLVARPPDPSRSPHRLLRFGFTSRRRAPRRFRPPADGPIPRRRPHTLVAVSGRPLAVLVNPTAGAGRALRALPPITAELERLRAEFRVIETSSAEHARKEARASAESGEAVAALGGDGLVGTLAGVMCGTDVPLAVLPGGRGNDLARVLGIPVEPAAAARVAVEGEARAIDVAHVDEATYVGIASCGFDSEANRIANESKLIRGNLVYLYAALRALAAWKHASFEVTVDGERHAARGYSVAVANSKAYGGGMYLAPHAEIDDGLLDVVISRESSKLHFLRGLPKVFDGSHVDDPNLSFVRGRDIRIEADRPFTVYADGDPIAEVPVEIRVARRVLRVMVPTP